MLFEFVRLYCCLFILRLTGFEWKARKRKDAAPVVANVAVPVKKKSRSPRIAAHKKNRRKKKGAKRDRDRIVKVT